MSISAQNPDISGDKQSAEDICPQNVTACQAVSDIVKTSPGPVVLDRMLMDDIIGDVTIETDGAAILRMLEVEHPTAKMIYDLQIRQAEVCKSND